VQLVEELDERAIRTLGHDRGGGRKGPPSEPHGEAGARPVRVAVGLTQVLVQPAGEGPAEHGVQYLDRVEVRCVAGRGRVSDADLGLCRAGLVHEEDPGGRRGAWFGDARSRYRRVLPTAEHLL